MTPSKVVGDQPNVLGDEVRSQRLNHLVFSCFFCFFRRVLKLMHLPIGEPQTETSRQMRDIETTVVEIEGFDSWTV